MTAALLRLPPATRLTLTWDQSSELAEHHLMDHLLTDGIYLAHPGSPWLRDSNGNTHGLLRQYFAKGSDLSVPLAKSYRPSPTGSTIAPRKRLDWRTPRDTFQTPLTS